MQGFNKSVPQAAIFIVHTKVASGGLFPCKHVPIPEKNVYSSQKRSCHVE